MPARGASCARAAARGRGGPPPPPGPAAPRPPTCAFPPPPTRSALPRASQRRWYVHSCGNFDGQFLSKLFFAYES